MEANQTSLDATKSEDLSSKIYLNYVISVSNREDARQLITEIEADTGMIPASITDDSGNKVII